MEIYAQIDKHGNVIPLTKEDQIKLEAAFPYGDVVLTSDNCPELAAEIERQSTILLNQNREVYDALARYD